MDSTRLRHPIEIYEIPILSTNYGTVKEGVPVYICKTKAHIIFDSQARVVESGEIYYPTDRTFVVRKYVPVTERCRIKWDDKWWNIVSINKNDYYGNIEIRCTQKNS